MRFEKAVVLIELARLLAGSAEGMTLDEIASVLHVSKRTAERLKATIETLFPQLESESDGHKLRFRIRGGLDGFLQTPTTEELVELRAASAALKATAGLERAKLLDSLCQKIESALRPVDRRRMAPDIQALSSAEAHAQQAGPRPQADAQTLDVIRTALKGGNALTFTYGPHANWLRTVSPWGILYGRAYYLVGPDLGKSEPVLWRIDKMSGLAIAGPAALPPEDWSMGDFALHSFGIFQEEPQNVVLRFSPNAAADAARFLFHPSQVFEPQPDGALIVRFKAGGSREMAYHLFTWGTEVEILQPQSLRRELKKMLTMALSHHSRKALLTL
ncbi:WYL domain-containing protein [Acetobacter sp. TBRC 12305]|uniref:WYL domain-containing protein n=1 Tax=Acetobacter garciniae TaxID=2817435 RepID=A0A939KQ01_9PROT|nr:WYL domain-containing protein [Acetobacter garciniae]MBO1324669.1 WYL domain-containing protein [Acetobacter garciniae]MBX0344358.1 WYL domain-containing protein [Acetobacter garciniae]